ncbi:hypothetical protein BMT55_11710 [Listeria newyorkensis]|uniref:dUTPase n=1 Tax=Listeria newyorkensis TaxID=1497681 RepID=A0ABX4XKQ7_9LIST|nr:dUTP diphosphatase [Listeria newyorkensis]PNP90637.1 hypothetical protein BMT55_11710 [Listeria newyorkensis]
MNTDKLLAEQAQLDEAIIKRKRLEGWSYFDRLMNTYVALDVELSEFANEGQWFKRWKQDPTPKADALKEYVDCIHFFLSIANQQGWGDALKLKNLDIETDQVDMDRSHANVYYLEIKHNLNASIINQQNDDVDAMDLKTCEMYFRLAWGIFIVLGRVYMRFTFDDMEQAYHDKNKVNHERQHNGY